MKNVFIILVIVISLGYMFVVLFNKYETIKETNNQISKTNQKTLDAKENKK